MKEKLAAVGAPVKAIFDRLVVGKPPRFSFRGAYQVDVVVFWIFQAMRDGIGDPRDLRPTGVGNDFLYLIVTVTDLLRQRR